MRVMGYVDEEGFFHSSEPENQPSPKGLSQKPDGCVGCGCAGCLGVLIVGFVITMIIVGVLLFSAGSMMDYIAENEDVIESQFEEHEDEIIDAFENIEDFMAGLEDGFLGIEPTE